MYLICYNINILRYVVCVKNALSLTCSLEEVAVEIVLERVRVTVQERQ